MGEEQDDKLNVVIPEHVTVRSKFRQWFWIEKFNNVPGVIVLTLFSILAGWATVQFGIVTGVLVLVGMVGIPAVYALVAFPKFGIFVLITLAYFLFFIARFGINFPLGTLLDGIQVLLILGFFIKQRRDSDWGRLKGSVTVVIIIWIGYNLLQVINPVAESMLAWVYTVRPVAIVTLMYFVFVSQIRTIAFLRFILKLWLGLVMIGALYAFKQEHFGFSEKEFAELVSDPLLTSLLFIDGHWRVYSIFSDPVAFSYNMVAGSCICLALLSGKHSIKRKIILVAMTAFMITTMLYSGTRGAYVLIPAALALFGILKLTKEILLFSAIAGLVLGILINIPTSNATLYRFQSAFKPSDDASFNLRKQNQKMIQPYIQTHPFGGGLGATGVWGVRFAPDSFLASFPPDSGYVRVAVELGWVGLLIFCIMMFTIMKTGIQYYYRIRNSELKNYCLAMLLVIFVFNLGNYPQEALVQFPSNINFYLAVAIIKVCYQMDRDGSMGASEAAAS
jgi:putative inorganic carbon (HCO3(-)) transporter